MSEPAQFCWTLALKQRQGYSWTMGKEAPYNYLHFNIEHVDVEAFPGPKPGETAPNFTARTLDDKSVKLSDYLDKPVVLSCGSITCPAYISKIKKMNKLQQEFPDYHFLLLYTRETHPGGRIPPHKLLVDKLRQAHHLQTLEKEQRTIIIGDIHGTVHQQYGALPNFCYLINRDGKVYYRSAWELPARIEAVLKQHQAHPDHLDMKSIEKLPAQFNTRFSTTFRVFHRAGLRSLIDNLRTLILR